MYFSSYIFSLTLTTKRPMLKLDLICISSIVWKLKTETLHLIHVVSNAQLGKGSFLQTWILS